MTLVPTLSISDAATKEWEAVVVGAGPAGAVAARELARGRVETLLVDKATFPRWKVCGCCLNGSALAILDGAGLGELPKRLGGVPLNGVRLAAGGTSAAVRLPGGVALSRTAFDAALVREAIAAGAAFLPATTAKFHDRASSTIRLRLRSSDAERVLNSRVVIVAAGLGGRLDIDDALAVQTAPTSRIGAGVVLPQADRFYRPGTIFMAVARGGYVGLVRVEDGGLDVAAAFDPELVRVSGGLGPAAEQVLREAGFPAGDGLGSAAWRGTPVLTRKAGRVAGERWFAVGDAAGYVEPFTGEGMAWALTTGMAVAPLAARAASAWSDSVATEWAALHRRLVRSRQRICHAAAWVLRSPAATGIAVRTLSLAPALARPVVAALNRPARLRLQTGP